MRNWVLSLLGMAMVAAAGAADEQHRVADDVLRFLGARLAQIRASAPPAYDAAPTSGISHLHGLSRERVLQALGRPDLCLVKNAPPDCLKQARWVYCFYRPPAGTRAGGPELWLDFDARDRVSNARYAWTE